jgi:hypothetical protein
MNELDKLKEKADSLGIKYPNNIGAMALSRKINITLGIEKSDADSEPQEETRELTEKAKARKIMGKLVRVRVTCNDPQFKKHPGLIRAAGNVNYFIKRYVPFNRPTHIEQCIFDFMKSTEYQWFEEKVNRTTGRKYKVPRSSPAFVIEELPPLTKEELEQLAKDQRSRDTFDD